MSNAYRFEQNLKKIKKNHFSKEGIRITDQIEDLFIESSHSIPQDMAKEVFAFFRAELETLEGSWDEYYEKAFSLGLVLELFANQLEKDQDVLPQAFWVHLSEIINEFAQDVEMSVLEPLMSQLVDHRAL